MAKCSLFLSSSLLGGRVCVPGGQSKVRGVVGDPLLGRARPRRQSRPLKGTERGLLDMTRRLQGGSRAGDQRRKLFWGAMLPWLGTSSLCRSQSTEEAGQWTARCPWPPARQKLATPNQLSPRAWATEPRVICSPGSYGWYRPRWYPALPLSSRPELRGPPCPLHVTATSPSSPDTSPEPLLLACLEAPALLSAAGREIKGSLLHPPLSPQPISNSICATPEGWY